MLNGRTCRLQPRIPLDQRGRRNQIRHWPTSEGEPMHTPARVVVRSLVVVLLGFLASLNCPASPTGQWTQLFPASSPPARYDAGIAYDESRGRLVLFGGTPST